MNINPIALRQDIPPAITTKQQKNMFKLNYVWTRVFEENDKTKF